MKLEDQVVSLELAKKLKSLNVKQESLHYWSRNKATKMEYRLGEFIGVYQPWETADTEHAFAAFTVAELGEILKATKYFSCFGKYRGEDKWMAGCYDYDIEQFIGKAEADTEADARAKMLIYLLENNLLQSRTVE